MTFAQILSGVAVHIRARESDRAEYVLGTARVLLAFTTLMALSFENIRPREHAVLAYGFLIAYLVFACLILFAVRIQPFPRVIPAIAHAVDVLWPFAISLLTGGPKTPFLLFCGFALVAAAYRWGLRITLLTVACFVLVVFLEGNNLVKPFSSAFVGGTVDFPHPYAMRSWYVLIVGVLAAYLGQTHRQFRAETETVSRLLQEITRSTGLRETAGSVVSTVMRLFCARRIVVVCRELDSGRVFCWDTERNQNDIAGARGRELDASEPLYSFTGIRSCFRICRKQNRELEILPLTDSATRFSAEGHTLLEDFFQENEFNRLLANGLKLGEEWEGEVVIFDPCFALHRHQQLRFLQKLVADLGPAIYNAYRAEQQRFEAASEERARLARELHDSSIQVFSAIEMEMEALRRQSASLQNIHAEIARMRSQIHHELGNMRQLVQKAPSEQMMPEQLLGFLRELVDRYGHETGILARFTTPLKEISIPPQVCRELARITQEALTNVRKHSRAQNVVVCLDRLGMLWRLVIEDDGTGMDFKGTLTLAELDAQEKGPRVIKERVHSIGGELMVHSSAAGTRIEVQFSPENARAAHG